METLDDLFARYDSLPALQRNSRQRFDLHEYLDYARQQGILSEEIHSGIVDIARTILAPVNQGRFAQERDYTTTVETYFWHVVVDLACPQTCYILQDILGSSRMTTSQAAQLLLKHQRDLMWLWGAEKGTDFFTVFNSNSDGGRLCDTQMVSNNYNDFSYWFVDPKQRK